MAPAALALDVAEVSTSPMRAGGRPPPQAMARQIRYVAKPGQRREFFEGSASDAGISFSVIATGKVLADGLLLRRAVSNLVSNAIRYTPKGETITLTATANDDGAVVSVSNPGPVIMQEHLPRVFDRFYISDKSRSSTSASAGLGLSIVNSFIGLHHGRASVTSELDGFTQFTLFFPETTAPNETV